MDPASAPTVVRRNEPGIAQAVKPAAAEPVAPRPRIWTVGTLTYTAGGLAALFAWLLIGDFAMGMREKSIGPLIEKFLLVQGASNITKQVFTFMLPTSIAMVLVPVLSYRSDRMRSRWGRRIPFLLIPTPVAGLAMVGIAFSTQMGEGLYHLTGHEAPPGVSLAQAAHRYTLGVFTLLWTIFEVAAITSGAVFGGLINDVVPRKLHGRFYGLFRAITLADGVIFQSLIFRQAAQHFTLIFALIGVMFAVGFTFSCLMIREGSYPPPDDGPSDIRAGGFTRALKAYARDCFSHRHYLLIYAMFTLAALSVRPSGDFSYRFSQQLNVSDADFGNLTAIGFTASFLLAIPMGLLVDRFGSLRITTVAMAFYTAATAYCTFFVRDGATFKIGFAAQIILNGVSITCAASLAQSLFPRGKFSQFAAAGTVMTQLALLIYAPLIGGLMDLTGDHYRLMYPIALSICVITFGLQCIVCRRYEALGGRRCYVAPGDDAPAVEPPGDCPRG